MPKSLQDRIQLFKDSKTLMKQKIKDLKASIKTIKSKYNAPLTMTNQLPKLEQALVDLQLLKFNRLKADSIMLKISKQLLKR